MQKLNDTFQNNKKVISYSLLGGAVALLGAYGFRRYQRTLITRAVDHYFETENLPLYATDAFARDRILKDVQYSLILSLSKSETFEGLLTANFQIKTEANKKDLENLFFDFQGKSIENYIINGHSLQPYQVDFNKHKIHIPPEYLDFGKINQVKVRFTNTYVNNSAGFTKYVDPVDKEIYMYTHLEPFFCHRWFPCFDQPSVRAKLNMTVISPDYNWKVVGNGKERLKVRLNEAGADDLFRGSDLESFLSSQNKENAQVHQFEETPPISTYIYGLFVGNFHVFTNTNPQEPVPMSIYIRKTKAEQLNSEELFRIISCGIKYYSNFFGTPFPFSKYDHIFCPEFRIGAMENVGAIAFNDDAFLKPKNEQTDSLHIRLAYVALHELAHMWFGDLVTMQWWTDLWLKESFADFMSATCLCEVPELKNYKNPELRLVTFTHWGLEDDVKSTTHPIQVEVRHTIDAVNIFDGICYEKGASFLKQMSHFVGRETMMKGTQMYFQKYQYQNTSLEDYIECVRIAYEQNQPKVDFRQWTNSWLTKSGANTLEPIIVQDKAKHTWHLDIKQHFPRFGDQIYREQVLDVALYYEGMYPKFIENVHIQAQEITKSIYDGELKNIPKFVFINANNKGYCRILLSPESATYLIDKLHLIPNTANRCYLWRTLADQIKLKTFKPQQFLQLVHENLQKEDEEQILPFILSTCDELIKYYMSSIEEKKEQCKVLYYSIQQKIQLTNDQNLKSSLVTHLLKFLPDAQLANALRWLQANELQLGTTFIPLNKSSRYQLIKAIYRSQDYTLEQKEQLIADEKAKELTEADSYQYEACQACLPGLEDKERIYKDYIEGKKYNVAYMKRTSHNFHDEFDLQISKHFEQKFFSDIEKVFQKQHRDYAEVFFLNLKPTFLASEEQLKKWSEILQRAMNTDNTHFINLVMEEMDQVKEILDVKQAM